MKPAGATSRTTRNRRSRSTPRAIASTILRGGVGVADGAVAVGTTRLTNLSTQIETQLDEDVAGGKVLQVKGWGNVQGTVGGFQTYAWGLLIGPDTLDAADVLPASDVDIRYWYHNLIVHRGQVHNVTSAVSEFDQFRLTMRTRGTRRLHTPGTALFLAEEVLGQTQNAAWTFRVVVDLA